MAGLKHALTPERVLAATGMSHSQEDASSGSPIRTVLIACGKCKEHGVDNVGTVPAALSTYLACQRHKPDLIVSVGTAGGFRAQGAEIGDVFVGTGTVNHDRRIPIPGFDKYGIDQRSATATHSLQKSLGLKSGLVSSGNSLDYTSQDLAFMQEQKVAVKEMEAAAIAWVAALFGIPMFSLKSITDIVDGERPPQEEFLENLQLAAQALQKIIMPVLEFVSGKTVSQL